MSHFIDIKLRLKNDIANDIALFQEKYNNVVRFSFNRFMGGMTRTEVFKLITTLNNVNELDVTWRREAAKLAESLAKATLEKDEDEQTIIFGGRRNFMRRLKGIIDHDTYKANQKLQPICCEGSKADNKGNRKFKFDFDNFCGSVKLFEHTVHFSCHKTSKMNLSLLEQLHSLVELKQSGVTYKLTPTHLHIVFDLDKLPKKGYDKKVGTTLAIDMNPNAIGLSIVDGNDTIVLRRVYDLYGLCGKSHAKRDFELTEIAKDISSLCIMYGVELVGIEKLTIRSSDKCKGKRYNKEVNNDWHRNRFSDSLKKWCCLVGCKVQEVAPQYSSFIGCIVYASETDSVAASLELNRRLREYKMVYLDKLKAKPSSIIYPSFTMSLFNRWKESIGSEVFDGWKTAYEWFKKSGHSYRLLYKQWVVRDSSIIEFLRFKSHKSGVNAVSCNKMQRFD